MKASGVPWIGNIPVDWDVSIILSEFEEVKNINKGMLEKNLLSLSYGNIVRKEINSNNGLLPDSFETYNVIPQNSIVLRLTDLQNDKRSLRSAICNEQGIITSAYTTIQLKSDIENHPRYMNYLFRCYDDCKVFYGLGNGVRQSINYSELKRVAILKPRYNCQMQIAKYLDIKCTQIDTIIAKEQSVIEKLQEYKKALITEAVTKGLNPNVNMKESGLDWIGKVPETYSLIKLKFLGEYFNGLTYSPDNLTDVDEGVLVLRSSNIKNGKLVLDDNVYVNVDTPRYLVKKNDILICSRNGSRNLVGKNILLSEDIHAYFGAFMMIFRLNSEVYSKWVYYVLNSNLFLAYLGFFFSSTINQLTGKDFGNIIIPICDVEEAKQITECLDEKCSNIDSIILKKQFTIDKLIEYKKSLIYEVVTGKKEVPHV